MKMPPFVPEPFDRYIYANPQLRRRATCSRSSAESSADCDRTRLDAALVNVISGIETMDTRRGGTP